MLEVAQQFRRGRDFAAVHAPAAQALGERFAEAGVGRGDERLRKDQAGEAALDGRLRRHVEGQLEPEGRALAGGALDADAAAHQLGDFSRDGQAEAGAAEFAGRRGVSLHERLKQFFDLLRREADAGVGDFKPQLDAAVRVGQRLDADDDLARLGELDAVADEVEQHLPEPVGVADQPVRHVAADDGGEAEVFARVAGRGVFEHAVHDVAQGEIFLRHAHLAGLDLGEVEHVVDDVEQGVGAGGGGGGELLLARVEARLREQLDHAENTAQWRANLVAHVREELALGGVGLVGGVPELEVHFFQRDLGLLQGQFRLLARRDVLDDGLKLKIFPAIPGKPPEVALLPFDVVVGGHGAAVKSPGRPVVRQSGQFFAQRRRLTGRQLLEKIRAEQLRFRLGVKLAEGRVHKGNFAVRQKAADQIRLLGQHGAQPAFVLHQAEARAPALGGEGGEQQVGRRHDAKIAADQLELRRIVVGQPVPLEQEIKSHGRHHQRAGGRPARAEPESAPQQERHGQVGQQEIVEAIDKPRRKGDQRGGGQSHRADRRLQRQQKFPAPQRRHRPDREDRCQHQQGQHIRHPPVQQVREPERPGKFIFAGQAGGIGGGIEDGDQPAGHQQICRHVAQPLL